LIKDNVNILFCFHKFIDDDKVFRVVKTLSSLIGNKSHTDSLTGIYSDIIDIRDWPREIEGYDINDYQPKSKKG
jgi:hypothetical protein